MSLRGGIDLGGTKIQAAVLDEANGVVGQARVPTPTAGGPADVVAALAATIAAAAADAGVKLESLAGIGVGSPGEIDAATGSVAQARNLPGWDGSHPLGPELSEQAGGVPVRLGNDVQVATDAEFQLGAAKPYDSVLGVFWGTGVGGGLVLGAKSWTGRGSAGEIGHMVVKPGGRRCPCGRRGCLEAYAGRAAMEAHARRRVRRGAETNLFEIMEQRGATRVTSGVWQRGLEHHDPLAEKIIKRAVKALGVGIASAVNLLDVEAVVIGGGLGVRLGAPYVERISAAMMPHVFSSERPPAVCVAALGDLGGAIGAALLVR